MRRLLENPGQPLAPVVASSLKLTTTDFHRNCNLSTIQEAVDAIVGTINEEISKNDHLPKILIRQRRRVLLNTNHGRIAQFARYNQYYRNRNDPSVNDQQFKAGALIRQVLDEMARQRLILGIFRVNGHGYFISA